MNFTKNIVKGFNVEFSNMIFGGTEKEILERGTDWCADYVPLFTGVAVNEYFPMNPGNDYSKSMANDYYLKMMKNENRESGWFMGEDKCIEPE